MREETQKQIQVANERMSQAEVTVNQLRQQLHQEQQRARGLRDRLEYAEVSAREAETQLHQSRSHWVVPKSEIELTDSELGTGAYGTVKVAVFRGSRVAAKCYHQVLLSEHNLPS